MPPVALVTGASRGIGLAIARTLAAADFAVALLARNREDLARVEAELRAAGRRALAVPCDVTDRAAVDRAVDTLTREFGDVSVLVNNAGLGGPFHLTTDVSDEEWDTLFATNVRSAFFFCRRLLPAMQAQRFGRIINITSIQGLIGAARSSTYVATKHALVGYTKSLAAEWGPHGITANAVCPGYVLSPASAPHAASLMPRIPTRTLVGMDDVANLVAFLTRPESGRINGAELVVDGGMLSDLGVS
jgi:3-oxoacyl-[acyl-carrier protein] reductase